MIHRCVLLAVIVVGLLAPDAAAQKPSREAQLKETICAGLVDVATWCHRRKWPARAREHLAEALGLVPNHGRAKALQAQLPEADTPPTKNVTSRYERLVWKQTAPRLAAQYLLLFGTKHDTRQQKLWDSYLIRAYVLSPRRALGTFESTWKAAYKTRDYDRARRLLEAVSDVSASPSVAAARARALEAMAPASSRIVKVLLTHAAWCHENGFGARAALLVAEALHHDPKHKAATALAAAVDSKATGPEAKRDAEAKAWAAAAAKLAPMYQAWAADATKAKSYRRYDNVYLARALSLDPETVGPAFDAAWKAARDKQAWATVSDLLLRARGVPADEETAAARAAALEASERAMSVTRPMYLKASTHDMRYFVSLPKGWEPGKKYPILVACDGRLCVFKSRAMSFMRHRGDRPFIVLSPCTFANTNDLKAILTGFSKEKGFSGSKPVNKYLVPAEFLTAKELLSKAVVQHYPDDKIDWMNTRRDERAKFDVAGLLVALADVRKRFGGKDRVYITGWSGGGILTWTLTLGYTQWVAAAAPACANHFPPLHKTAAPDQKFSTHPSRKTLPIRGFQGMKDRYIKMMEQQWAWALKTCKDNGFENVNRTDLPDVAHKDCVKEVWGFFEKVWKETDKDPE